jgi:hypothetical protein
LTISGGEVTEVQDLSGNNFDVTPPSSTYNPTIASTTQNGKTLIEFDGTDYLQNTSITTPTSGNLQVFIVCNVTNADHASDSILSMNSTSNDFQIDSASTNWKGRILTENIGSQSTQTGISIITGMNIWNASFDFGSSEYLLRLNGDQLNGTIRGNYTSKLATNMQLRLFSNRGANRFPEGQVAEVIIYEDITEGQRQKVEGYLAHKWGLESKLSSTHPFKTSAPGVGEAPPQFGPTGITVTDTTNWVSGLSVSDLGTTIDLNKIDGRSSYTPGETVQWYGIPVTIISEESDGTYTIDLPT